MSRKAMEAKKPVERVQAGSMRLDKYLKVSRIIKRRSVANDACSTGHITINARKPSQAQMCALAMCWVCALAEKYTEYEVLSIGEHALKQDAADMYRVKA